MPAKKVMAYVPRLTWRGSQITTIAGRTPMALSQCVYAFDQGRPRSTDKQKFSVMYEKRLNHRIIWQGQGRIPMPEWGKSQTNPIDENLDQLANSWKLRLNHDYIITNALVNHFTFSADNYFNRGANKTMGQGWIRIWRFKAFRPTMVPSPPSAFRAESVSPLDLEQIMTRTG